MKLSLVELATVAPGTTETDALSDALETTRHADALGFHRVWFAEHHGTSAVASHHPELLITAAATQTKNIRVGSGGVLMNHASAFTVAERFKQLDAMFPGRIDLGMGRATAGIILDAALRQDRQSRHVDDHQEKITETLAWLHRAFSPDHPFASYPLLPTVQTGPEAWLLGSSPQGAHLAAELGIGYCFAGFINARGAAGALQTYRKSFRKRRFGPKTPQAILAVNVSVGEDEADAIRLVSSVKGYYARLSTGDMKALVPSAEEAMRELTPDLLAEPTSIVDGVWPRFVAGSPEQVRATLGQMLEVSGADELMVQNMIARPADRRASHARLAEVFGLKSP